MPGIVVALPSYTTPRDTIQPLVCLERLANLQSGGAARSIHRETARARPQSLRAESTDRVPSQRRTSTRTQMHSNLKCTRLPAPLSAQEIALLSLGAGTTRERPTRSDCRRDARRPA